MSEREQFEEWFTKQLDNPDSPFHIDDKFACRLAFHAGQRGQRERAITACQRLRPKTSTDASGYDDQYQAACDDCINAIRQQEE